MHKFLYSIAQNLYNYEDSFNYDSWDSSGNDNICDDFKRVELKGTYQTFHVDCQGYDIDGSEIFPLLQWSNCGRYYNGYYNGEPLLMEYYNETIQEYVLTASKYNFAHCSHCNWCKQFDFDNLMVSY